MTLGTWRWTIDTRLILALWILGDKLLAHGYGLWALGYEFYTLRDEIYTPGGGF